MKVQFNYHDSYIDSIEIRDKQGISVRIVLYSVYYPDNTIVELIFSDIFNWGKVKQYFESIRNEADSQLEIGCRIDHLDYDTKQDSKVGDYYLHLISDWEGKITIHCKTFSEQVVK